MGKFKVGRLRAIFGFILIALFMGAFGCSAKGEKAVTSVESVKLSLSWYGGGVDYEITKINEAVEIKYYKDEYVDGQGFVSVLKNTATCDEAEFVELMNDCRVMKWDGFSGTNQEVMDGTSFTFTAYVNGSRKIYASGYMDYPKGYKEFTKGISSILDNSKVTE